jgi:phosphoribosylaminoimidazole-succinocarboxamide synthase
MIESDKFDKPLFTPSTKADLGEHDENISIAKMEELVGKDEAAKIIDVSVRLYQKAAEYALSRGIIIADTKFELGWYEGELILIDEVLTPDSSRFWPLDKYTPGTGQPSFDKQFLRDYLATLDWDKKVPAPALPEEILVKTAARYEEAVDKIIGG